MKEILLACLIALTLTSAKAQPQYTCELQENGSCVINLTEMFPDHKYDIDDVLAYCDYVDGVLDPEADTCTIGVQHD